MEDIRIYDFDFNLLDIESKIVSTSHRIYFNDIGKAEIHLPENTKAAEVLFDNRYLLMTQGEKQAIITGVQLGTECIIYGRTPNWILTRKVLAPVTEQTVSAEEFVRSAVSKAFEESDSFVLGDLCGIEDELVVNEESYVSLADSVKSILDGIGAGHRVRFDIKNKKWIFEVLKGEKRPLVISESNLNCYGTEYMFDLQNYFSLGVYKLRESQTEDSPIWEEIKTEEKSGLYKWETVLYSSCEADAKRELEKSRIEESITAKLREIKCGKDYELGDSLKVKFAKGDLKRTKELKVIGADFWNEANDSGEMPILE